MNKIASAIQWKTSDWTTQEGKLVGSGWCELVAEGNMEIERQEALGEPSR